MSGAINSIESFRDENDDPEVARLSAPILDEGILHIPASRIRLLARQDSAGLYECGIILADVAGLGVALPFSALCLREMALAMNNMAQVMEEAASAQAGQALAAARGVA